MKKMLRAGLDTGFIFKRRAMHGDPLAGIGLVLASARRPRFLPSTSFRSATAKSATGRIRHLLTGLSGRIIPRTISRVSIHAAAARLYSTGAL